MTPGKTEISAANPTRKPLKGLLAFAVPPDAKEKTLKAASFKVLVFATVKISLEYGNRVRKFVNFLSLFVGSTPKMSLWRPLLLCPYQSNSFGY